jgi:hypothetical protein
MGVSLEGVPLGSFDFGGAIGVKPTGDTDTIIQRLQNATPGSPTISIQLDALQLETEAPTTFGGMVPSGTYFITLDPSKASMGQMTINFATATSGTFSSSLDVWFDIHAGSLTGTQEGPAIELTLQNGSANWSTIAPPGAELINEVNNLLNGSTTANDFWPGGTVTEMHTGGAAHQVTDADVPDGGSTLALLALPAGLCAIVRRCWKGASAVRLS